MRSRTDRRLAFAGLLTLITAALMTLAPAWPAQAHTELVEVTPRSGVTLKKLPAHATLVFSEVTSVKDLTVRSGATVLPVQQVPGRASAAGAPPGARRCYGPSRMRPRPCRA